MCLLVVCPGLKVAGACKMFKAVDKLHRNFSYMHCWMILKDQPKWIGRHKHMSTSKPVAKKQKTTANSSPSSAPLSITAGNVGDGQPAEGAQELEFVKIVSACPRDII